MWSFAKVLPNLAVRGIAIPVGEVGKVRFARQPKSPPKGSSPRSRLFDECIGDLALIEKAVRSRLAQSLAETPGGLNRSTSISTFTCPQSRRQNIHAPMAVRPDMARKSALPMASCGASPARGTKMTWPCRNRCSAIGLISPKLAIPIAQHGRNGPCSTARLIRCKDWVAWPRSRNAETSLISGSPNCARLGIKRRKPVLGNSVKEKH
jgi:hypothetical protein